MLAYTQIIIHQSMNLKGSSKAKLHSTFFNLLLVNRKKMTPINVFYQYISTAKTLTGVKEQSATVLK